MVHILSGSRFVPQSTNTHTGIGVLRNGTTKIGTKIVFWGLWYEKVSHGDKQFLQGNVVWM